ncbi:myelin basic protein, isoform CRA_c, partial [Mus musculus]
GLRAAASTTLEHPIGSPWETTLERENYLLRRPVRMERFTEERLERREAWASFLRRPQRTVMCLDSHTRTTHYGSLPQKSQHGRTQDENPVVHFFKNIVTPRTPPPSQGKGGRDSRSGSPMARR